MSSHGLAASEGSGNEVEYATISSTKTTPLERPDRLHEWLTSDEIEKLHRKFVTHPGAKLSYSDLREVLQGIDIHFTDAEYNRLFLKINQNRDFLCDWNEFISYLIFGFQEDDPSSQKETLILPIASQPLVRKTEHRSAVCCLALLKTISDQIPLEEEVDESKLSNLSTDESAESSGMWITASHEGQIRFWSPQMEPIRTGTSQSSKLKRT